MRILFIVVNPDFKECYLKIARNLVKKNHEVNILTNRNDIENYFIESCFDDNNIHNVNDYDEYFKFKKNYERYFEIILSKFNLDFLSDLALREMYIYNRSENYLKKQICLYYKLLKLFTDYDVIINPDHGLFNVIVDRFAKHHKILTINKHGMAITPGKLIFDKHIELIDWVQHSNKELNEEDNKKVTEYINNIKNKQNIVGLKPVTITFKRFKHFFKYTYRYLIAGKSRKDFLSPLTLINKWGLIPIRKHIVKRYYKEFDKNIDYYYFPLQVWDDISILLNNNDYFLQYKLVQEISNIIPKNIKLIVKEHPVMLGTMPVHWLNKIRELDNIILVSPKINSHKIIKNCKKVIIVSSTVGLEAMIWNKPVLALGNTFYSKLVPKKTLKDLDKIKPVNELKLKMFIRDMLNSEYDCHIYKTDMSINVDDKNIEKVTNALLNAIKRYKNV